jgi:polyisoprenoid-binding protein YceI
VLDAARYPFARVRVTDVTGAGDERVATVAITLHGVTRDLRIPLRMLASADEIDVSGAVTLRQTDFGIVPLSVLGGAIQVEDAIDLRFRILAKRTK